jgi:hypothetical protein
MPLFWATVKETVPLPAPEVAPSVIQPVAVVALHGQSLPLAVIVIVPLPPAAPKLPEVGLMVVLQPPACVTWNGCPAMETTPVRGALVEASTVTLADPLPLPLPLTCNQLSDPEVLQGQPPEVVTATGIVEPLAPTEAAVGEML